MTASRRAQARPVRSRAAVTAPKPGGPEVATAPRQLLVARDLVGSLVVTADGQRLGRVIDVEIDIPAGWLVMALELGRYALLDRLHLLRPVDERLPGHRPRVVPWEAVEAVADGRVNVRAGTEPTEVAPAREPTGESPVITE